jgi:hypothetical protein
MSPVAKKIVAPKKWRPKRVINPIDRAMKEDQMQRALFTQWRLRGTPKSTFVHIPNEGSRGAGETWNLKKMGLMPGFPDLLLRGDPDYLGEGVIAEPFLLELKRAGVAPTPERREILEGLFERGWLVYCADTLDDAVALLETHGVLKCGIERYVR